ncbi:hypothetical protein MKX03_022198, partial [Papaver bracteatum]
FPEAPKDFPFKIVEREECIRLTREYQGEEIKVKVEVPSLQRHNFGYGEDKRY